MASQRITVQLTELLKAKAAVAMMLDHRSMNSLLCKALDSYCRQLEQDMPDDWTMAFDALHDISELDMDKAKLERSLEKEEDR